MKGKKRRMYAPVHRFPYEAIVAVHKQVESTARQQALQRPLPRSQLHEQSKCYTQLASHLELKGGGAIEWQCCRASTNVHFIAWQTSSFCTVANCCNRSFRSAVTWSFSSGAARVRLMFAFYGSYHIVFDAYLNRSGSQVERQCLIRSMRGRVIYLQKNNIMSKKKKKKHSILVKPTFNTFEAWISGLYREETPFDWLSICCIRFCKLAFK